MNQIIIDEIIKNALIEDMNYGDITTDTLIEENGTSLAVITAKQAGVVVGLSVAGRVFEMLDSDISFQALKSDGDTIQKGEMIAKIKGKTRAILKGERLALNLLQRMSGIATKAREYSELVKGTGTRIADTRKTTPSLRILEKYAVRMGGCHNHRFNLSDAVMIKDNHIEAVGGIAKAIKKVRMTVSHTVKIEVEVQSLEQLEEAIAAKADIIMLDNMDVDTMKKAVEINNGRAVLEASGNITSERIKEISAIGVDIISVGALTHSVKALDISLNIIG
ncbi:MAG: carboxylating nicotinate-nucleotide diphosphorylase [Alkaliphilus sp.]|nr:carboxylating nicotinate-nucleotide diphosphorylase [Alkaliphilus sp.]